MTGDSLGVSAVTLRQRIDNDEISAAELVEEALARADLYDPALNAIVARRDDEARREAGDADRLPHSQRGLLHGIPILIKDLSDVTGMPSRSGSLTSSSEPVGFDSVLVRRLRDAGAIVVGKTSTPEFGWRPTTESRINGFTANPFSPNHTPGGSSGGSAAAVASGIVSLATGGDSGGSLRIPASCCSVIGMRPSRGRIPLGPRRVENMAGLTTNGPIARTVADARLMFRVMAGPSAGEPYGVSTIGIRKGREIAGGRRRIAVSMSPPHGGIDPEVIAATERAAETLREIGHDVVPIDLDLSGLDDSFMTLVEAIAAMNAELAGDNQLSLLEDNTLALALRGRQKSAADFLMALTTIRSVSARILADTDDFDALLTPTLTQLPLPQAARLDADSHDERWTTYLDWMSFCYPFNCTGQPAISLPGGLSSDGLPVGVQLVGRMGADDELFDLSAEFERASPWAQHYARLVQS